MKQVFGVRDLVNILPYDEVENHFGIDRGTWEFMESNNPCEIRMISHFNPEYQTYIYHLRCDVFDLYWPGFAFAENQDKTVVSFIEVGDLL